MKPLFVALFLCTTITVNARKFDITAQTGCTIARIANVRQNGTASSLGFRYHPFRYLAVALLYDYSHTSGRSDYYPGTQCHSLRMMPELATKHFFIGAGGGIAVPKNASTNREIATITYKPAFVYGAHIGLKQNIGKHLALTEQVAYNTLSAKTTTEVPTPDWVKLATVPIGLCGDGSWWGSSISTNKMSFYAVQIGLSYSF